MKVRKLEGEKFVIAGGLLKFKVTEVEVGS